MFLQHFFLFQDQDSFMYRDQQGVKSFLLDDDNCDCLSTLSMGHGLCGTTFSTSYGPVKRFVAILFFLCVIVTRYNS
jgi:hypothetical protein